MDLSLSKLPWWGQIGAFVLVCGGAVYGFWHFYVSEMQADITVRETRLTAMRADIARGVATARRLPEFEAQVDAELVRAESESLQLRSVLAQVQKFETRKAQLTQRVTLIEQLRRGQTAPVHVLDEVSKSLPERVWLSEMKQTGADFFLQGQAVSLPSLSDFVSNLEATKWFIKPVEILDSQVQADAKVGDLVRFSLKATLNNPEAPPVPPAGRGGK